MSQYLHYLHYLPAYLLIYLRIHGISQERERGKAETCRQPDQRSDLTRCSVIYIASNLRRPALLTNTETRGPTRRETQISEACSYASLAAANSYFEILPEGSAESRIAREERALDSYSNLLFSILHFWSLHGTWPAKLTIVSHAFKRERLVDCHCQAIRFPLHRINFVGIDPQGMADGSNKAAIPGVVDAVHHWKRDPHGKGDALSSKRTWRNPWGISQTLFLSHQDRSRSGVRSHVHEHGQEYLIDGVPQPWSEEWPSPVIR